MGKSEKVMLPHHSAPTCTGRYKMPRAIGEWKVCSKCKEKKHVSEYHKGDKSDGLSSSCKECKNAWTREYKKRNRKMLREKDKEYRETEQGKHNAKIRMRRWRASSEENREKTRKYARDYYHNNKEKCASRQKEWRKTPEGRKKLLIQLERRRDRKNNVIADLTSKGIDYLLEVQDHRCGKCEREFTKELPITLDHIKPLRLGGNLTIGNVQLLCRSCNSSKGTKDTRYIPELPRNLTIKERNLSYKV